MAARLFSNRSKALAFTLNRTILNHSPSQLTRPLHSRIAPFLIESQQSSGSIPPASRFVPKTNIPGASVPTAISSSIGSNKIMNDGRILHRWFSSNGEGKPTEFSTAAKEEVEKMAKTPAKPIISFSPLEAVSAKPRSSGLGNESLKIKRTELVDKITFALIPALILTSKGSLTTSILVLSVYWQVYGFFKEIFLDYVHQEVTRKWVLIYFQILLLILAKDTFLNFGLV